MAVLAQSPTNRQASERAQVQTGEGCVRVSERRAVSVKRPEKHPWVMAVLPSLTVNRRQQAS